MLTDEQKTKLDEAAVFNRFKESQFYHVLTSMLQEYRLKAIQEMEADTRITNTEATLEMMRRVHAVNGLIRHIEAAIDDKIAQVGDVADELGVDLDELTIRREINANT